MTTSLPAPVRVAIYTRKSTEEGLEQEFNSLDAQREAALAYIANRRHLSWQVVADEYNDGGYTGGNMERPALQRLLRDIRQRRIDCVVTYKLDRISRSLIDFAQLMTLFEQYGVAFVSITQEFDSSTPVGRLTLNILSSFSQFEREIISERTRDKMAASRKKGMFVGGFPPFGYDIDPRTHKLVINPAEADIVRDVFATFLELKSVTAVMHTLNAKGYRTKTFTSRRGRVYPGNPWCRFYIRRVLTNPLYIGNIRYRGQLYTGQQEPIISNTQWEHVQALLPAAHVKPPMTTNRQVALLRGLLRCGVCACAMTPSSCRKPKKAYRYYVCLTSQRHGQRTCPVRSIPAGELEAVIIQELRSLFRSPERLTAAVRERQPEEGADVRAVYQAVVALQQLDRTWDSLYPAVQQRIIRLLVEAVMVYPDHVDICGGWGAAVNAAGFDYESIRRYRKWTRDRVIARIQEWHEKGADLSWRHVAEELDPPLAAAVYHGKRFDSWAEALSAAGLNPKQIARYRTWSLPAVHEELAQLLARNVPLRQDVLQRGHSALLAAVYRRGRGLAVERETVAEKMVAPARKRRFA